MWSTGDGFDPESRNKAVYRHTVTIDLRPYIPPEKIDAKTGHVVHDTTWKVLAEQRSNIRLTPQARDPSRQHAPSTATAAPAQSETLIKSMNRDGFLGTKVMNIRGNNIFRDRCYKVGIEYFGGNPCGNALH